MLSFQRAVSSILSSIIRERFNSNGFDATTHQRIETFVLRQWANMPDFTRLAIFMLTLGVDFFGFIIGLRPFHSLPEEKRREFIDALRNSPVSVLRDLVRFYETLTVFGWFAEV
jgi:hypothetical protein